MAEQPQQTQGKPKAGRSPAFPFINLKKALERVDQLYRAESRHAVPPSSAYRAFGLGAKGGAAKQTLAALKHYGLVEYEGRGGDRQAKVSDLAYKILEDHREDTTEKELLIKVAALRPRIFADMWREWGLRLPSDATIEHFLVHKKDYKPAGAKGMISIYKDTIAFSKLAETDKMPDETTDSSSGEDDDDDGLPTIKVGDYIQWEPNGVLQFDPPRRVVKVLSDDGFVFVEGSTTGIPMAETYSVEPAKQSEVPTAIISIPQQRSPIGDALLGHTIQEERVLDDDGNDIVIRFRGDRAKMYKFLSAYAEWKLERLPKSNQSEANK